MNFEQLPHRNKKFKYELLYTSSQKVVTFIGLIKIACAYVYK